MLSAGKKCVTSVIVLTLALGVVAVPGFAATLNGDKTGGLSPKTGEDISSNKKDQGDQPKKKWSFSKKTGDAASASSEASQTSGKSKSRKASPVTAQTPSHPGDVWVNLDTGIYHKGGRWYGKTRNGKFMSERAAIQAGYQEDRSEARR